MIRTLVSAGLLMIGLSAMAAANLESKRSGETRYFVSMHNSFLDRDYLMGFGAGISLPSDLSFGISFDFHPVKDRVQEEVRRFYLIQYSLRRYYLSGGVEQLFSVNKYLGFYAGVQGAYTWGEYYGTLADPEKGWTIIPGGGMAITPVRSFRIKLGYEYRDAKSTAVLNHRVMVVLQYRGKL